VTQRDGVSYNEAIGLAVQPAVGSSPALMMEPPVADWRKRQARLDWLHSQNFGGVAAEPAQPISAAPPVRSGVVGRTFHDGIGLCGIAQMESAGVRLRESPLPWRRVRQIFLSFFRSTK
jgi:hypothetical protein